MLFPNMVCLTVALAFRPRDPHGHADVRLLQRRRVVDAVAGHSHDGAAALTTWIIIWEERRQGK
jgi:hypothetical protein